MPDPNDPAVRFYIAMKAWLARQPVVDLGVPQPKEIPGLNLTKTPQSSWNTPEQAMTEFRLPPKQVRAAVGRLTLFGWKFPRHRKGTTPSIAVSPDGFRFTLMAGMAEFELANPECGPFDLGDAAPSGSPHADVLRAMADVARIVERAAQRGRLFPTAGDESP